MAISIALRPVPEAITIVTVSQELAEALEGLGDDSIEVRVEDLEQIREEGEDYGLTPASVDLLDTLIDDARKYERSSGSEGGYFSIDVWY